MNARELRVTRDWRLRLNAALSRSGQPSLNSLALESRLEPDLTRSKARDALKTHVRLVSTRLTSDQARLNTHCDYLRYSSSHGAQKMFFLRCITGRFYAPPAMSLIAQGRQPAI